MSSAGKKRNSRVCSRKTNPTDYLFNVRDAEETLSEVSEGAIREVAGKTKLDFILTEGRSEIAVLTQDLIQKTLDEYGTGIVITKVNLQDANFPLQVEDAVQDAIKAREDKERFAFEAEEHEDWCDHPSKTCRISSE